MLILKVGDGTGCLLSDGALFFFLSFFLGAFLFWLKTFRRLLESLTEEGFHLLPITVSSSIRANQENIEFLEESLGLL